MKFYRSILLGVVCFLGLCSCSNKASSQPQEENSNNETTIEYLNRNITYTSTSLENGSVEDTVDKIYDSVVAIDSYQNQANYGSGSGVLFAYDEKFSYIVTCHHVIEDCQSFMITLANEDELEAKLVGGDKKSDIAVLSVEKTNLTYASWFENTDTLRLGSAVICIGNPLGTLPGSVSTGVVSYNNRKIKVDTYNEMKLIQTDVAINSGNSGGGLFNSAGALIGIVNAKYSSTGIEGLGFAIPANEARQIVDSILSTAKYQTSTNSWDKGYVIGRWEIGFTLGYGGYGFTRTIIGIADVGDNKTYSDYSKLEKNDILNSIYINYQDSSKDPKALNNISAKTMTIDDVYNFIYNADLAIGDVIAFDITRGDSNIRVEVPLIQYCYSI